MSFGDICHMSLSNLWSTKLRTVLTTLGVIIGIGALVAMVAFGSGMQKNIADELRRNEVFTTMEVVPAKVDMEDVMTGDIESIAEGLGEDVSVLDDAALDSIRALPGVEIAYPDIHFPVKMRLRGKETRGRLQAVPADLMRYSPFNNIAYGRFFEDDDESSVIVSYWVLNRLGIRLSEEYPNPEEAEEDTAEKFVYISTDSLLGKEMTLVTSVLDETKLDPFSLGQGFPNVQAPFREEEVRLKVVGILPKPTGFEMGYFLSGVLVPLGAAKSMPRLGFSSLWDLLDTMGKPQGYSSVRVRVSEMRELDPAKEKVEAMGYTVITIADQLKEMKKGFIIMDSVLGAVGVVALIVAALGIINTMVTSILERTREIGIMKAIGGSEAEIRWIFFVEAGGIGLVGGLLGLVLGWSVTRIASAVVNSYLIRPEGIADVEFFHLPTWLLLGAVVFSIVVSLAAGVYPAMRAARVDPVQALRHD